MTKLTEAELALINEGYSKESWCEMWRIPEGECDAAWASKQAMHARQEPSAPAVVGDIEPFVSTLDGTLISSRAVLREHNLRNNVVSLADVKGLPPKLAVTEHVPTQKERDETKRTIWHAMNVNRK